MRYLLSLALTALLAAPVSVAETANPAPGPKPSAPPDGVHGTTGIVSADTVSGMKAAASWRRSATRSLPGGRSPRKAGCGCSEN